MRHERRRVPFWTGVRCIPAACIAKADFLTVAMPAACIRAINASNAELNAALSDTSFLSFLRLDFNFLYEIVDR